LALEEPGRACGFDSDAFVQLDDFVQCGVGQMQECLSELKEKGAKAHWYEAEIKIRDQRIQDYIDAHKDYVLLTDRRLKAKAAYIQELEEQVASLQRVIQHRRDSDSVVDG
jgi:polyhydroxyalkanoate synthesis regulator phasin